MIEIIRRQFEPSMTMLEKTIDAWPDDQWAQSELEEPPAWQVMLHVLMGIEYWLQTEPGKYEIPKFSEGVNVNLGEISEVALSREALKNYFSKMRATVDAFFSKLSDQQLTAPAIAYDQWTNLDVILENIRHAQHHLGQLNARLKRIGHLPIEWVYYNPA